MYEDIREIGKRQQKLGYKLNKNGLLSPLSLSLSPSLSLSLSFFLSFFFFLVLFSLLILFAYEHLEAEWCALPCNFCVWVPVQVSWLMRCYQMEKKLF